MVAFNPYGSGIGGQYGSFAQEAERIRQEALIRAGAGESLIAGTGGAAGFLVQAKRMKKDAEAKLRGELAAELAKEWFGPPTANWAAVDMLVAFCAGGLKAASIKSAAQGAGKDALANAAFSVGRKLLESTPGASEIIAALDLAGKLPLIGDLTDEIEGFVKDIFGTGTEIIGGITGGVMDIGEEIPGAGVVLGGIREGLKKIPLLGDLF